MDHSNFLLPESNNHTPAPKKRGRPKKKAAASLEQEQTQLPALDSAEPTKNKKPRARKIEPETSLTEPTQEARLEPKTAVEAPQQRIHFEYAPTPPPSQDWQPGAASVAQQPVYTGLPTGEPKPAELIASEQPTPNEPSTQQHKRPGSFQPERRKNGFDHHRKPNHFKPTHFQPNKPNPHGQHNRPHDAKPNLNKPKPQPSFKKKQRDAQPWTAEPKGIELQMGQLEQWEAIQSLEAIAAHRQQVWADDAKSIDFSGLYKLPIHALMQTLTEMGIENRPGMNRHALLKAAFDDAQANHKKLHIQGVLEILDNGHGLLVYAHDSYAQKPFNAFVPMAFIRHHRLMNGHELTVLAQPPRLDETTPCVLSIEQVLGEPLENLSHRVSFNELTPYYPLERILLEYEGATWDNVAMRVVDLLCPIGLGQRGLIVAPPRTGKTILLQNIAHAIAVNMPKAHLIVLLIDERPEEVTDFRRHVKGEVIASTFDQSAEAHVHAAEMVIAKARRMVEAGQHVIILLDSITRLARAYNTLVPSSGKILSGGVEANALERPKRFFGSARNIEGGGSLTILGTALVETGSKMDEVIFEEFKGTGNMELHLDRALSEKRVFPALNLEKSGTRKEELLYHTDELSKIYALRRAMKGVPAVDAMEMLIQRVKKTKSNVEFLVSQR